MITISDSLLRALGWTLVHSLWQAALAAVVLLVFLPRLQTARRRYWAAYGALVVVFLAAAGTFLWVFEPRGRAGAAPTNFAESLPTATSFFVENQYFETNIGAWFAQWLEANHALIVAVWLIGFVFFLLRLGGGLWQIQRLRLRGSNVSEAAFWQEKLCTLSIRIGVSREVSLLESVWVKTPLTLGWLKPVILLPIGFVNQLSAAEVEAVLAHELAHIARRDWVFNLFQAFIESLFYYHPAVWWVSQVIHRERENACDDAALAATGNPLAFARALVQVQEMAAPAPALALAISGKRRRPLLERVRRILNQAPQQQHQVMEKITATLVLLALLILVGLRANPVPSIEAAFAQIADIPTSLFGSQGEESQMLSDSLPKPKKTRKITREDEDGRVEAEYKDGRITRLNIDGKEIPAAEFEEHEALIEELEEDVPTPAPRVFWQGSDGRVFDMPAPPAPDAPRFFRFGSPEAPMLTPAPLAPIAPLAPLGNGISIVTDKDGEGNTIIHLDNNGNGTEVVVKNGEVWIDGKKIKKGEQIDIPGVYLGDGGKYFLFDGAEGRGYAFGDGDFSWGDGDAIAYSRGISPEQRERMEEELARAREDQSRIMEEHRRGFERDRKLAERELRAAERELRKQEKEWQKEQKNWEREQKAWAEGQQRWKAKQQAWEAKNKAAQEMLRKELLRDGLIADPDNFSLKINEKELKINNKKQPEEMRRKYETLIKNEMGMNLEGDDWNYNFNFNTNNN